MKQKYWIRVIYDDGKTSVLTHRNRTEWTLKTAIKYADEFSTKFGFTCYILEA